MIQRIGDRASLSDKIAKNTVYNTVGTFWGTLVSFVLVPYIIAHIGAERFGVWAIIGVITSYFGLLDFGIGTAFVKYISHFYAKQEFDKVNEVVNTGLFYYGVFAIAVIIMAIFFTGPLLDLFKVPARLHNEAVFVFIVGITVFALSNALSPFLALQSGLQRMDISNKISIGASFVNIAGTVFVLERGYGLPGLMVNNAVVFTVGTAASIITMARIFPQWSVSPRFISKKVFIELFRFGYKLQVSRLANFVSFQADKLFIAYFLNMGMVTFYQLGSSLLQGLRQIPLLLVSALVPAVSEVHAQKDTGSLETIFIRGSKYLVIAATPIIALVFINAPLIMAVWMGKGYGLTVLVIRMLSIGYYAATVTGAASSIAAGVGRTDIDMKFGLWMAVLNITLSVVLIIKIGFIGAVIGTTVSLFVASIYFMILFGQYFGGKNIRAFAGLFTKPVFASALAAGIIVILNRVFFLAHGLPGRIEGLGIFFFEASIFIFIYSAVIMAGRYVDAADRRLISDRIPLLKGVVNIGLR
jgi:O-antigen/teichoic acid export membrane protein